MDIFGSSNQVPAWLREVARPVDAEKLGATIGTGLAEVATALSRDPNAAQDADWLDSRKGFVNAISEVRANQTDQFWKIKTQQMQQNLLATQARTTSQLALGEERKRESSAWMDDAPKLSSWASATPEDRATMPTPDVKSKAGIGIVNKTRTADDGYFTRKQSAENNSEAVKIGLANTKEFINRVGKLDPDLQARVNGPKAQPNKDGTPSQTQWEILQQAEQDQQARTEKKAEEAKAAGATVTTKAGPKGTTTTIQTKPERVTAAESLENAVEKAEQNAKDAEADGDTEAAQMYKDRAMRLRRQQKGGDLSEPKEIVLSNGQKAVWIPGSKGLQILRDPKKEAEGKVAYTDWLEANRALIAATKADDADQIKANQKLVADKRAALNKFWEQSSQQPPATQAKAQQGEALPTDKSKMVKDKLYTVPGHKGLWKWDGKQLVQQKE